jgi:hypothetical protein
MLLHLYRGIGVLADCLVGAPPISVMNSSFDHPRRRNRNDPGIVRQASRRFRVGLTRLVNEHDIRTPQHIKNRARNDPGILATDMKSVARALSSMRDMRLENGIRN